MRVRRPHKKRVVPPPALLTMIPDMIGLSIMDSSIDDRAVRDIWNERGLSVCVCVLCVYEYRVWG